MYLITISLQNVKQCIEFRLGKGMALAHRPDILGSDKKCLAVSDVPSARERVVQSANVVQVELETWTALEQPGPRRRRRTPRTAYGTEK